jgi:4-amino-4-deoxy-L-arabinose transferase-like glycosyltransferase
VRASIRLLPLLIALVGGAALRAELAGVAPPFLVANDSADYFTAGYTFLQTGELQLSLKRTPLYPIFLAGLVQIVGPSLDRLLTMQHLLGLATVGLTYLLGRMTFGTLAAGATALAVAINGSILTMEHLLISEALYTPLLLAGLAALVWAVRSVRAAPWLLAGILLGLGTLCRRLGLGVLLVALAPLGAAWAFARHRHTGAAAIPLVVLSQVVLYVALDGPLFRYRLPYQPPIIILGAAGLALVGQHVVASWRGSRMRRR